VRYGHARVLKYTALEGHNDTCAKIMTDEKKPTVYPKYKHEQLQEVLVELFLERAPNWSKNLATTIATAIDPKLIWKDTRRTADYQIKFGPDGDRLEKANEMMVEQFSPPEGGFLIQLAESLVVVNLFPPYKGFAALHGLMLKALAAWEAACGKRRYLRAGLRYIDRLLIPERKFDLSKYFNVYPATSPEVDKITGDMSLYRGEIEFVGKLPRHRLLLRHGSAASDRPGTVAFMIDTYDIGDGTSLKGTADDLSAWMIEAHDLAVPLFNATITDEMKRILNEGLPETK
jgi:uncharacterized protein (TIGR04255 family)